MDIKRVWAVYFSPTGGTKKVVMMIAKQLSEQFKVPCEEINFTREENRERLYEFSKEDLVVIGSCVYAGRLPNKIMPDFKKCFRGNGAMAIPITVFGNRSYGGALTELRLLLQEAKFLVVAAAAVVSQHAFSSLLATGRPDENDKKEIDSFLGAIESKIVNMDDVKEIDAETFRTMELRLPEDTIVEPYYIPKKEDGTPAKFLAAKPLTDTQKCNLCGLCAKVCPMGSIDVDDVTQVTKICIKCQACVKKCPKQAKYFADEQFLSHVKMLEQNYTKRHENFFLV